MNNNYCARAGLVRYATKAKADQEIEKISQMRKGRGLPGNSGRAAKKCAHCRDGWHIATGQARQDWVKGKSRR